MHWKVDPKVKITYHAPDLNVGDLQMLAIELTSLVSPAKPTWNLGLPAVPSGAEVCITHAALAADTNASLSHTRLIVHGTARVTLSVAEQARLLRTVRTTLGTAGLNPAMELWPLYTEAMLEPTELYTGLLSGYGARPKDCLMYMASIEATPELAQLYSSADEPQVPLETTTQFAAGASIVW